MSIHKSLALKSRMRRHRNVLTRAERIQRLKAEEKWDEDKSVFGLPKVKIARRVRAAKPKKEAAAAATVESTGAQASAAPAAASAAKPEKTEKAEKK